jgi:hypothetical protein
MVLFTIDNVTKDGDYSIVSGFSKDVQDKVQIKYPSSSIVPNIGKRVVITIYSMDSKEWHSSKENLIRKGASHV